MVEIRTERMALMYPLSFSSLLIVMQATSGTHAFRAKVPAGRLRTEACLAHIQVSDGKLVSCRVSSPAGLTILQQQKACATLEQMGDLDWEAVLPSSHAPAVPLSPHTSVRLIRGVIPASLPRKERQVLALMDGERSHEDIARLLHLSAEEMQHILTQLRQHQLIR